MKIKKLFSLLLVSVFGITLLSGCKKDENKDEGCGELTLDEVNAFLNDSETMNMNKANAVAVIPFNHVNGPKAEWKFYALVNFQSEERTYVKYQVTYISCTCRAANVNYWQTAYVELTKSSKGNPEEAELKRLSFDADGTGHYTAGFWGDSSPIYDEGTGELVATYDEKILIDENDPSKGYYPTIKYEFIPKLIGMQKKEIDKYKFAEDLKEGGVLTQEEYDAFHGASVSTNNILRILHALFEYHASVESFWD